MRILLVSIFWVICSALAFGQQSPHGPIKSACNTCHTTDSWKMRKDATFDHASTSFALEGQHKAVPCAACHENLKFRPAATKCSSCHTDAHVGELGTDCARCHTPTAWSIPNFRQQHDQTRFPLLGAHTRIACTDCHSGVAGRRYRGLPITCASCHQSDYKETRNPNHLAAGFSTNCTQCHALTASSWGTGFDHGTTRFPLTGAHLQQQCQACHANNTFASMSIECVTCHQNAFNSAANPNHVNSGFPSLCQQCHTTTAWKPASFDHAATKFPLVGAHLAVACTDCHKNNQYSNMSTSCSSCHSDDFSSTQNPNHVTMQFSQDCAQCHTTIAWTPASFDHAATRFVLTGAHLSTDCQSCHVSGNYQLTYSDCYQCHSTDFTKSSLNHTASNFSHTCSPCHTTAAWKPASFDHSTTNFVLTGSHVSATCQSCHVNGNYQLTYSDCYQCHSTDFTKSTVLVHATNNLSHNCTPCHTTTAWMPSTFNHDGQYFRIYSGRHNGRWTQCSTCHPSAAAFSQFTCLSCHEHNQTETNGHHTGVSGYVYASPNCYSCHRNV